MIRKTLLALLLCSPINADNSPILWLTSVIGISGLVYTLLAKHTVQSELSSYKKRFRYQEHLSDRYEAAFDAVSNYKNYTEIVAQGLSPEATANSISEVLSKQFTHDAHLLPTFLEQTITLRQKLEFKKKEIDNVLADWSNNRKKKLLNLQGPHIQETFTLIVSTLKLLEEQIPYTQAYLFLQDTVLKEEYELYRNRARLTERLATHIVTSSEVGLRYPYRSYVTKIDSYHDQAHSLKAALDKQDLLPFQEATREYLHETYQVLDFIKKTIKASEEYKHECAKYEAERVAHAREKENEALKKQLAELKKQLQALKETPTKA